MLLDRRGVRFGEPIQRIGVGVIFGDVEGRHLRMPISSIGQCTDAGNGRYGNFFSVTVTAGDSFGLSVCFVNSPIGSAVDVDRT
jgi:hypothetical protein